MPGLFNLNNMKQEKKEIRTKYCYNINRCSFEGNLNKTIEFLKNLPEHVKSNDGAFRHDSKKYFFIRYEIDFELDDDGGTVLFFCAVRLETNEEFNTRLDEEENLEIAAKKKTEKEAKNKEIEEKALLEILRKKYENS